MGLRGLGLIYLERLKIALGLVDKTAGAGTANTAMVCHAARLLALNEGDLPYALRIMCDGLIEAVGRVAVSGPVGRSFTAHPKVDPVTGEMYSHHGWFVYLVVHLYPHSYGVVTAGRHAYQAEWLQLSQRHTLPPHICSHLARYA